MAKSSSAWKRKRTWSFSEMEMDVARQLMLLCQEYISDKRVAEKQKEEGIDESNPMGRWKKDHPLQENEEDEHLQPRKRRFKSIDLIYSSTKPLIIQNLKPMKV
ncbi:hypothetical protein DITRI_Ditri15bG0046300 [Diplodiscus trichospermus]